MGRIAETYRALPIKQKLRLIIMASVSVSLSLACAAVLVYDHVSWRQFMKTDLGMIAEMYGSGSTAALSFYDGKAADELLSGLKAKRSILLAVLYDSQGLPFAQYRRDAVPARAAPPVLASERVWFEPAALKLFKFIPLDGQNIGAIYLESDLAELNLRLKRFAEMVALILLGTALLALWLSSRLQRIIAQPIMHLAATAMSVSRDKNYAVRATAFAEDEIGQFTDTFNEMLSEIERRDGELLQHRDRLENEVE